MNTINTFYVSKTFKEPNFIRTKVAIFTWIIMSQVKKKKKSKPHMFEEQNDIVIN